MNMGMGVQVSRASRVCACTWVSRRPACASRWISKGTRVGLERTCMAVDGASEGGCRVRAHDRDDVAGEDMGKSDVEVEVKVERSQRGKSSCQWQSLTR